VLPYNLLAMTFGNGLNLSLEGATLPSALLAMTLDYELNQSFWLLVEAPRRVPDREAHCPCAWCPHRCR
jgi:hypothetical protein